MPTYLYSCSCGYTEARSRRAEAYLEEVYCPHCGRPMRRDYRAEAANVIPPRP